MLQNNILMHFYFLIIFFISFFDCVNKTGKWNSEVINASDKLKNNRLSTDNSILLLPLITSYGFDTSIALSPKNQTELLKKIQKHISFYYRADLENEFSKKNNIKELDNFYKKLIDGKTLDLTVFHSVWESMPSHYVMVFRINNGSRIRSFDGILKRKVLLEAELWDSEKVEIVWHAKSSGVEMNKDKSDAEFILNGIRNTFELLPEFFRAVNESNW
ncbi:MAG: hypothetical protein PVI26_00340 [Chitinispirillia bacterium]|jgi:hypothetical protein